ncbi:hypothetical protein C5167_004157 [Papaver somniferum]|nr:hypothetical protein C5167_004157 [Papaver somniferum]
MEFEQHDDSEEDLGLSMEFEQHDDSEEDFETILGPSMEFEQPVMHDDSEEDLETILGIDATSKSQQKQRGPTTMSKLFKSSKGLKKVVEYNELGQPVGCVATQLSSFFGVLTRYMVPIIYEKWTKGKFVLRSNSKKNMIKNIGALWRSFKSRLTRKYILPYKDQADVLVHPPAMYKFIKQRHWEAFVKSRLSTNFQVFREILSTKRKKNIYPHRLSRKGYAGLVEQLKQKEGFSFDELDRSILWKKAREDKSGVIPHDATRERVKTIDKLAKQVKEGSLVTSGSNDILTLALGTAEPSGNVRAMGKFVSQGSYFHTVRLSIREEREARLRVEAELQKLNERIAHVLEQLALVLQTQKYGDDLFIPAVGLQNQSLKEREVPMKAQFLVVIWPEQRSIALEVGLQMYNSFKGLPKTWPTEKFQIFG